MAFVGLLFEYLDAQPCRNAERPRPFDHVVAAARDGSTSSGLSPRRRVAASQVGGWSPGIFRERSRHDRRSHRDLSVRVRHRHASCVRACPSSASTARPLRTPSEIPGSSPGRETRRLRQDRDAYDGRVEPRECRGASRTGSASARRTLRARRTQLAPEERGHPYGPRVRRSHASRRCSRRGAPGLGLEWVDGTRRWRVGQPPVAPRRRARATTGATWPSESMARLSLDSSRSRACAPTQPRGRRARARWLRGLAPERRHSMARRDAPGKQRGIAAERCIGEHNPRDKAHFLDRLDHRDTLFVGDGVTTLSPSTTPTCSGTPAVDRPFVPRARISSSSLPGLAPVRLALRSARALAQVVRVDLAIALSYNALTVAFALAGKMSPLACAVLMPSAHSPPSPRRSRRSPRGAACGSRDPASFRQPDARRRARCCCSRSPADSVTSTTLTGSRCFPSRTTERATR